MKISRSALMKTIDQWIKDREAKTASYDKAAQAYREGWDKSWFNTEAKALLALGKMFEDKIAKKQVVTQNDVTDVIQKSLRNKRFPSMSDVLYSIPSFSIMGVGQVRPNPEVTAKILALKDFLEMVSDEQINSSSLERMGFRDIQFLFKAAYDLQRTSK